MVPVVGGGRESTTVKQHERTSQHIEWSGTNKNRKSATERESEGEVCQRVRFVTTCRYKVPVESIPFRDTPWGLSEQGAELFHLGF